MAVNPVRRIVTGHDASGKAIVVSDGPSPHLRSSPTRPGVTYTNVWTIDAAPAPIDGPADPVTMKMNLEPPRLGNNLRIVEFEPEAKHKDAISKTGARDGKHLNFSACVDDVNHRRAGKHQRHNQRLAEQTCRMWPANNGTTTRSLANVYDAL